MAKTIVNQRIINETPATDEYGVVVRLVGGSGPSGDVTIVGPLGQADMANSIPVVIASDQSPIAVTGSFSPSGTQDTNLISVGGDAIDLGQENSGNSIPVVIASDQPSFTVVTGPGSQVAVVTSALPTGAATEAKQTQPGVDIGDVTVNNGAGAAAVNIQDGGNTITVDGTVVLGPGSLTNIQGNVAHDSPVSTNVPVSISALSQDVDATAPPNRVSAENDVTRVISDRDGVTFSHPHGPQIENFHENSSSALTDQQVFASAGSGLSHYITDIVISTGAATAFNAFFEEGSTIVLGPYYLEAINGRGVCIHFQTPKKLTAATALTVTTSAAIAHSIEVNGFIAP